MKKSITEAMDLARELSAKYPGTTVRVMDKYRKQATVTMTYHEFTLKAAGGWHTEAIFRDGEKVTR